VHSVFRFVPLIPNVQICAAADSALNTRS